MPFEGSLSPNTTAFLDDCVGQMEKHRAHPGHQQRCKPGARGMKRPRRAVSPVQRWDPIHPRGSCSACGPEGNVWWSGWQSPLSSTGFYSVSSYCVPSMACRATCTQLPKIPATGLIFLFYLSCPFTLNSLFICIHLLYEF